MNKKIIFAGLTSVLVGFGAQSAFAASDTATSSVVIAAPITITKTIDLDFGTILAGTAGGTAVVSAAGASTFTGDVTAFGGTSGTAASFDITGDGTSTFSISHPSTTMTGTGPAMALAFANSSGATGALVAGAATVTVGGTLTVAAEATQTVGAYTGTMTVTVDYN